MSNAFQRFYAGMLGNDARGRARAKRTPAGGKGQQPDAERKDDRRNKGQPGTRNVVLSLLLAPSAALVVYTLISGSWSAFGVAIMVASAAFALGTFLGFLFGIPRTLAAGGVALRGRVGNHQPDAGGEDERGADDGRPRYVPNTNLEDISDWLTKILVGAGLVELTRVTHSLGRFADRIAPAFGGTKGEQGAAWAFALGLLVAYLVGGFLSGYVFTRLRLQALFALADDLNTVKRDVKREVIRAVDEQRTADAEALALLERQLDTNDTQPDSRELDAAVIAASDGARKQIFNLARSQRRANRRDDKEKMALTIPVFRALIAADPAQRYFRNFGELGLALYDQDPPDYADAAKNLDKAIEIRDRLGVPGYEYYDWIRAMCRIEVPAGDPESAKQQILADLRRAATDPKIAKLMRQDKALVAWCERNGLPLDTVVPPPPT